MRCLWVSGDVPHPPTYGKLVYSAGLSEALAAAGVDVVGVGLSPRDADAPTSAVCWRGVRRERAGRAASLRSPLPSMAFATTPLLDTVRQLLADGNFDAVVVDHLEVGWVADAVGRAGPPIVYVAHNHERSVRAEVARQPGRLDRLLALQWDARRAQRLERRLENGAALVVTITDVDAARFQRDRPELPVLVLTPGYRGPRRATRTIDAHTPRQATIVTSLDWHVKQANLASFVAVADPVFASAGVALAVAGNAPSAFTARLVRSTRATTMLGRIDDLTQLLDETRVGVIAEPLGGGFKLKLLDYVFGRVPMASVTGSMEGVPLRDGSDHLVFPNARALAEGVVEVIDDFPRLNQLQERAFDRCAAGFDWADRGMQLADALARVARARQ